MDDELLNKMDDLVEGLKQMDNRLNSVEERQEQLQQVMKEEQQEEESDRIRERFYQN
ncbi:hypothetical protein MWH28_03185 [Natroniella sulfidigena]|uniref:hypothetical protein n=1 Tax=Natroniella sulfidigena TaxID=723921 RepID=UPI00200B35B2|nr:hypothetical protein [Natroniella sulfidigena]MCK8816368.1 hypothetical protein [Natroniella sulfidigena]